MSSVPHSTTFRARECEDAPRQQLVAACLDDEGRAEGTALCFTTPEAARVGWVQVREREGERGRDSPACSCVGGEVPPAGAGGRQARAVRLPAEPLLPARGARGAPEALRGGRHGRQQVGVSTGTLKCNRDFNMVLTMQQGFQYGP